MGCAWFVLEAFRSTATWPSTAECVAWHRRRQRGTTCTGDGGWGLSLLLCCCPKVNLLPSAVTCIGLPVQYRQYNTVPYRTNSIVGVNDNTRYAVNDNTRYAEEIVDIDL